MASMRVIVHGVRIRALATVLLVHGCGDPAMSGFSSGSGMAHTSAPGSTGSSTGGGASAEAGAGTSTSTGAVDDSSAGPASTTLVLDVGGAEDVGWLHPVGCKGKIDFLFVVSRHGFMDAVQAQLIDAVPKFIETIQTKFADFDYHIMVVKGDPWWGSQSCDPECPGPFSASCPPGYDYPCEMVGKASGCDQTWGAGVVFNAGEGATNAPCEIAGGRRYLTRDEPDLAVSFACIAQVGVDGGDLLGQTLAHAVSSEMNGPGGCNEGFLRDDALLVITLVTTTADHHSNGTPAEWAQAVFDAKHGDDSAVVMFGIHHKKIDGECWESPGLNQYDRACDFVARFPYSHWIPVGEPDYGPGFDVATDLVDVACSEFIPQ